jgi:hypothetical protein
MNGQDYLGFLLTQTSPFKRLGEKTNNVGRVFGLTPFKRVGTGSVSSQS